MRIVWAIFRKELRTWFVSPLAYVFLGVFLFLAGLFFYIGNLSVALLFLLPMLTMKHFAEEQRQGTFELLMTAPVPLWALLLGKWLASLFLCGLLLSGTWIFPVILDYYGDPDWGVIWTSYLGLFLCCGAFVSAGLFSSSLTDEPVAAGMGGVLILLPFWLAGAVSDMVETEWIRETLERLAFQTHMEPFARGVVDSADCAWFGLFSFAFLFGTWRSIESRRWR